MVMSGRVKTPPPPPPSVSGPPSRKQLLTVSHANSFILFFSLQPRQTEDGRRDDSAAPRHDRRSDENKTQPAASQAQRATNKNTANTNTPRATQTKKRTTKTGGKTLALQTAHKQNPPRWKWKWAGGGRGRPRDVTRNAFSPSLSFLAHTKATEREGRERTGGTGA